MDGDLVQEEMLWHQNASTVSPPPSVLDRNKLLTRCQPQALEMWKSGFFFLLPLLLLLSSLWATLVNNLLWLQQKAPKAGTFCAPQEKNGVVLSWSELWTCRALRTEKWGTAKRSLREWHCLMKQLACWICVQRSVTVWNTVVHLLCYNKHPAICREHKAKWFTFEGRAFWCGSDKGVSSKAFFFFSTEAFQRAMSVLSLPLRKITSRECVREGTRRVSDWIRRLFHHDKYSFKWRRLSCTDTRTRLLPSHCSGEIMPYSSHEPESWIRKRTNTRPRAGKKSLRDKRLLEHSQAI